MSVRAGRSIRGNGLSRFHLKAGAAHPTMSKKPSVSRVRGFINLLADFLSSWRGFVAVFLVLIAGIGAALRFDENYMFGFNIFLSISAIVVSGVILVAGAQAQGRPGNRKGGS
jgi:divalent metal cation (Fe/Co/Zn/Cd) transporter